MYASCFMWAPHFTNTTHRHPSRFSSRGDTGQTVLQSQRYHIAAWRFCVNTMLKPCTAAHQHTQCCSNSLTLLAIAGCHSKWDTQALSHQLPDAHCILLEKCSVLTQVLEGHWLWLSWHNTEVRTSKCALWFLGQSLSVPVQSAGTLATIIPVLTPPYTVLCL